MAFKLASAARFAMLVPDLAENAVQPMPAIAVRSLIACSGMLRLERLADPERRVT
jgi:hypothetical protein